MRNSRSKIFSKLFLYKLWNIHCRESANKVLEPVSGTILYPKIITKIRAKQRKIYHVKLNFKFKVNQNEWTREVGFSNSINID